GIPILLLPRRYEASGCSGPCRLKPELQTLTAVSPAFSPSRRAAFLFLLPESCPASGRSPTGGSAALHPPAQFPQPCPNGTTPSSLVPGGYRGAPGPGGLQSWQDRALPP